VEIVPLDVPVVTTPTPLVVPITAATLLVLFTIPGVAVVGVNGVVTTTTAEVVLVADTLTEVLTDIGREVVPGGGVVERPLV
jgi:hypothetical protein